MLDQTQAMVIKRLLSLTGYNQERVLKFTRLLFIIVSLAICMKELLW